MDIGASFDSLGYFEKLKAAGVPEAQAKVQVAALRQAMEDYAQKSPEEFATKGDIQDVRLEMQKMKYELLKWQFGFAFALAVIMAKGFGWLGF